MASVRKLKRDIDLIFSSVLSDCFYVLDQNSKVDEKKILKIVENIIEKHRELRIRTNHPDGKDNSKMIKKYYKDIASELLETADKAYKELSSEIKKVK